MLGEFFDPKAELGISEHYRPHWSQTGAIVFITMRTHDSIPIEVLNRWDREKQEWLQRRGFGMNTHWSKSLPLLDVKARNEFNKEFGRQKENFLDSCHGRCLLGQPAFTQIVADALMHFDGERYRMGDFVVMPNHVHFLAAFSSADSLVKQCDSWMHFTAFKINQELGEKGKFWQQEAFDHLVRSPEQYEYLRKYIANNGPKAGLSRSAYFFRRYESE